MVQGTSQLLLGKRYHGLMRRMKLKCKVRPSPKPEIKPTCLSEMSAMMACWRENSFNDPPCMKEINDFISCSSKVHANPEAYLAKSRYPWSATEVNERLRRFVRPQ